MTAVFVDSNGVKKNFLWQSDRGQILEINELDYNVSPEVHFTKSSLKEALVAIGHYSNGTLQISIPDVLLLDARKITVYLYINGSLSGETVKTLDIFVRPRKKPNDYILLDGNYIIDETSVENAIRKYIKESADIENIVVDYTTVQLVDDVSKESYYVGVAGGEIYLKDSQEDALIKNADTLRF